MEFQGKRFLFLGDSITEGVGASGVDRCFVSLLQARHKDAEFLNYGIGGTRLADQKVPVAGQEHWEHPFYTRVVDMVCPADVVCVFGGTNDYGHGDAPFGKFGDSTPATFRGALRFLSLALREKYPEARIVFFTPLHRSDEEQPAVRKDGMFGLSDYVKAIRENAEYFSFPVLDFYAASGLQPAVPAVCKRYFTDGLHPNDAGYVRLFELVENFLRLLA